MILKDAILSFFLIINIYIHPTWSQMSQEEMLTFLETVYEPFAVDNCKKLSQANWNVATDSTNTVYQQELIQITNEVAEDRLTMWRDNFEDVNVDDYDDEMLKRQLRFLKIVGSSILEPQDLDELTTVKLDMSTTYSTAKICPFENQECETNEMLSLEPDIEAIMASSTNYEELTYVWEAWRDASGAKILEHYPKYVELSNEVASENGFQNMGEMWRDRYETDNFIETLHALWDEVKPLYDELHTYVRNKLQTQYGDEVDMSDGFIPANILGNMWAQSWVNIEPLVRPFPDASAVDVTQTMKDDATIDVQWMFEKSNEFYRLMGLEDCSMSYDEDSMIEKPTDKEVVCHASAWDFCDGETFRIKMCTEVDMEDFITVHHEMGHIQYYLLYKDQPITFRGGANPGFHEAVGDTIALSVSTPGHLQTLGLLPEYEDSDESAINALMLMALERVAFLPFGLLIDKWRWDVFSGEVQETEWNDKWWEYREQYQKIRAPVDRTEDDFDPGAKYHVAGDSQYINYFVAHILQFQLYKSLCRTAGKYDPDDPDGKPLHKCDFYGDESAGDKLRAGLELGSSVPWPDALEAITGERVLDASALIEYFKPLMDYLSAKNMLEADIANFINSYNSELEGLYTAQVQANWNYATDITPEHADAWNAASLQRAAFERDNWKTVFQYLDEEDYQDETLRRQIRFLKVLGNAALDDTRLNELNTIKSSMSDTYNTAKICPFEKQDCDLETDEMLSLEPDIEAIMASSTNYEELTYVWEAWRDASGAKIRQHYPQYVELSNDAATKNGFENMGEMWRYRYETDNFIETLDALWDEVKPLYNELHTYVRNKLQALYGDEVDMSDGLIPANILGNMWAQSWVNIEPLVRPFPDASAVDVTQAMKDNETIDVLWMFEKSNEFYLSMGLEDCSMSYGTGSMIEKPTDIEVVCHASAWDFSDGETFRIKMCTEVDMEDFITVHHEMGHIQYYLLYKDQPITFRGGANPGFHEAVGDTIALSVSTPEHLKAIGLLPEYEDSDESSINALMRMALERVAFLPFGLLIDKWRWDVFSGYVEETEWNDKWWEYREQYQKIRAPVGRTEDDFDPGAKYHVAGDSQYINYFVARILQFQLYKSLCISAEEYDPADPDGKPLHKCDFFEKEPAGNQLREGLELGSSKPWPDALEEIIGERELDASALIEYFKPLMDYLREENLKNFIESEYNPELEKLRTAEAEAKWNHDTDITQEHADVWNEAIIERATFQREHWNTRFQFLNEEDYQDETLRRQIKFLKVLGNAALNDTQLNELNTIKSSMAATYSTAKICPFANQECETEEMLSLEPDIEAIMASSTNYEELTYVWTAWRDASGANIREYYPQYVELSNEVATENGFEDMGEMWQDRYETDNFIETLDALWDEVKPLYNELHTYVRNKLQALYGDEVDMSDGFIKANILGNMWAQSWVNIEPHVRPFPDASAVDVTQAMKDDETIDVQWMFEKSNEFYLSMELEDCSMSYGPGSMIEKPTDKEVVCHASAWDFSDGETFRIKMCTEVDMEDFITVHHEMGHIQYFLLYKDQPITFRGGANPGFHEAVGDTIALSVSTPQHLQTLGLLPEYEDSDESSINALMLMALERVAFLPFGLLIDKWRWDVFSGEVQETEWNDKWWEYREQYQKIRAPVDRTEDDFDPGAKYHVAGDSQYINYFVAHILQFQMYKSLCITAGEYDPDDPDGKPLHKCDFYGNKSAGDKLRAGLELGSSVPWPDALEEITGERALDASALIEYFKPLMDYLRAKNMPEVDLASFIHGYNIDVQALYTAEVEAEWNYATDVTQEHAEASNAATLERASFERENWKTLFRHLDEGNYQDEILRRQIKFLKVLGNAALNDTQLTDLNAAISAMTHIYSTAAICPYDDQDCEEPTLKLEPDIEGLMASSTNYDQLLYLWESWRSVSGAKMRDDFKTYVTLSNEAAEANDFRDKGEMWLSRFESDDLVQDLDKLWEDVEPLYKELHQYVQRKLKVRYPDDLDLNDRLIPAHVFGNMWAQSWVNLASLAIPYPDAAAIDVTSALEDQEYTVERMFEVANEFYTSLELENTERSYGEGAMIERPLDREVVCHASAWDFYDQDRFRVKMCTEVNYEDFITIHHELGHIQYFLLYQDQPITLRTGANPGFHEAVGDTIALSVATTKRLQQLELLPDYEESPQADLNALMNMALERVAFLPFGLLIDKWRWDVFSGRVPEEEWNQHWWHYRETIQGIKAPVTRTEEHFDPGAKFHVAADYQYISYFVAHILEFQFYKALCREAGEYNPETKDPPLHKCDYFGSVAAGERLRAALSLGASKHWTEVLEILTGETEMDASALNEYFEPLLAYLLEEKQNIPLEELRLLLGDFDKRARTTLGSQANADWDFEINIGSADRAAAQVQAVLDVVTFRRSWLEIFGPLNEDGYTDDDTARQLSTLKELGDAKLADEKLEQLRSTINEMKTKHGTTKVCRFSSPNCNPITQGINQEAVQASMAGSSTTYEELEFLWERWRAAGADVKETFATYVGLANEAARARGYEDRGDQWRKEYGTSSADVDTLWDEVEPLYTELHTFVINQLKQKYEDDWDDAILAPLFGSIWSDSWYNLASLVRPHPDAGSIDVANVLESKQLIDIFTGVNEFFLSLNLKDTSAVYAAGGNSIIERATGSDMSCQPSAWSFHDGEEYRVKICTTRDREGYVAAHRILSHIQYFLQYEDQPTAFRSAANQALYEAIGGAFALSAVALKHFAAIEWVEEVVETEEAYLNMLMDVALERVAALPFALAMDKWRWDVFSGLAQNNWNDRWWQYRRTYQNISSPSTITNQEFDLGTRYEIIADEQIGSYFASGILEFQIYRALCITADKYDPETKDPPLYQCDFHDSPEVGELLQEALSAGSSKDWSEVLEIILGDTAVNATAVSEYFDPLYEYLKERNDSGVSHISVSVILYLCSFFVVYYIPKLLW